MIKYVDSGGQVRLVTNIRKPRKWKRFEYLLLSEDAYIDTEVSPNDNYKIAFKFYSTVTGSFYITGTRASSGSQIFTFTGSRSNSNTMFNVNGTYSVVNFTRISSGYTLEGSLESNNGYYRGILSGNTTYDSGNVQYTSIGNNSLHTFIFSNGFNIISGGISRCYYYKIWSNGVLVRDFVPAQYNGQYGMWDLVEDKFYPNKGTGTFTVGPEIKNYDEIHEVRRASGIYPVWTPIEYLESSGTLYINTGYKPNLNTSFKASVLYTSLPNSSTYYSFMGVRDTNATLPLYSTSFNSSTLYYSGIGLSQLLNTPYVYLANKIYNYEHDKNHLAINNDIFYFTTTGTYLSSLNIYLFGRNTNGNFSNGMKGRIYKFLLYDSGLLVRDFIPVRIGNIGYLFDKVTGKMFGNSGTGNFVLGPDINT